MCVRPLILHVKPKHFNGSLTGERVVQVPCGHCIECLKDKQNSWFVRLYSEFQGKEVLFFTLTYAPEHVPTVINSETGEFYHSVCAEHLQSCMKRFRMQYERRFGRGDFKYFITSEYGPKTNRPHYHGIISLSKAEFTPFLLDWQKRYGFTQSSKVNSLSASLRYVTKYAIKGAYDNPNIKQGFVKKNFRLISKKIGYNWIKNNMYLFLHPHFKDKKDSIHKYKNEYLDKIISSLKINIQGFNYKLPKYFKDILFKNKTRLQIALKARIQEKHDSFFVRELEQLQASIGYGKAVQMLSTLELSSFYEKVESARDKRLSYVKFLQLSKL